MGSLVSSSWLHSYGYCFAQVVWGEVVAARFKSEATDALDLLLPPGAALLSQTT